MLLQVIGAETVTLAPDGRMGVVDKWGRVRGGALLLMQRLCC
jgi:hypothetical protein